MRAYLPGVLFLLALIAVPVVLQLTRARDAEPGVDFAGGTELIYTVDGDAGVVAGILQERLDAYGATAEADVVDGRIHVLVAAADEEHVPDLRALLDQPGGLEFRITVEQEATEHYGEYWMAFRNEGSRDVTPAAADRSRYPHGLRWYPVVEGAPENLRSRAMDDDEPWMLCALDGYDITEHALYDVHAARNRSGFGGGWIVTFRVKKLFQRSMAALTDYEPDKYMAIILNGEVHMAPILSSTLSDTGQISGDYSEDDARRLAATLASGRLPAIPVLVSEAPIAD